jgi:hypothetical protein
MNIVAVKRHNVINIIYQYVLSAFLGQKLSTIADGLLVDDMFLFLPLNIKL